MSITPEKKVDSAKASVPSSNGSFPSKDAARIRSELLDRRESLVRKQEHQLDALNSPEKHHIADLEEMTSDSADADSLSTLLDLNSSNLDQIDNALEKLDQGTYGVCERCEETIPKARLEFLPFAPLCVDCQRQQELEGPPPEE